MTSKGTPYYFHQLSAKALQVLRWILVAAFYGAALFGLKIAEENDSAQGRLLFVLLLSPIALTCFAQAQDLRRDEAGMDDFHGDWLFFRYGDLINWMTLSIPVQTDWSFKTTFDSAQASRAALAQRIAGRVPPEAVHVIDPKAVTDLESEETKHFTRVRVRSRFGSSVTFFIHYAVFGHTITSHYFTYRRGTYGTWDVVKFILASPLTIWFWGLPWLTNRYSIIAAISQFRDSSFDAIDLETMYKVTHRVIFEETEAILREAGLLTEEIAQVINYQIANGGTLQNFQVVNSPNATVKDITQSAQQKVA
jgi:hypothetical protein